MRQHNSWFRITGLLLGIALLAAACGGDDDSATGKKSNKPKEDPAIAALRQTGDANPPCKGKSNGVFEVGGLLAETGDLGDILGAPQAAGAALAVADVNKAGGVNGKPMKYTPKDSGDAEPDLATPAVEAHLQAGVDAILGASASQISQNQIEKIIGACTIMFSPSNTGPLFTTYKDKDLYFRTAAADILQGRVLAQQAIDDGATNGVILARQDAYGQGLDTYIKSAFVESGGTIKDDIFYDPKASDFSSEIGKVVADKPDALFLVGFDESSTILSGLIEKGFTPKTNKIYFVEGNMADTVGKAINKAGALVGIKGTIPGAEVQKPFHDRMLKQDPKLTTFTYGPETYDAVTILALAADAAKTDESDEVARKINSVTRDGEKCKDYASCKALLDQGKDIDYDGQSGPVDFAKPGEPSAASYGIYGWTQDNKVDTKDVVYKATKI
jgi:ABC-type branched-subunit amino acid transport system substrate-binding protein